jgi:hypothetical protein
VIDLAEMERQFADPAAGCRRAEPFVHYVWDGLFDEDALRQAVRSYPDVTAMIQKPGIPRWHSQDLALPGPALRALCDTLLSDELAKQVSLVTGVPGLRTDPTGDWGSFRISTQGAVHAPHVGSNLHPETGWLRRYSLFSYLNEGWEAADGGLLELWRPGADTAAARVVPVFNRSVLIETTERSLHGVSTLNTAPGVARRTVTVHFWTPPEESGAR